MVSFWPWRSRHERIKDLKAPELAETATTILQKFGRNTRSARLIYRALELDPYQPQALLMMSELFRGKSIGARPKGDEIFAGIIIEYAVGFKSPISLENKRFFDKAREEILKSWGFVKPVGNEFDVDHLGYMAYINELMGQVGSVNNGFQTARRKLGIQAGIIHPATGKPTRVYKEWLSSNASTPQH